MAGTLYSANDIDADGRQFLTDNTVRSVLYYDSSQESWDKTGASNQSWYRELFIPNDTFSLNSISTDKWSLIDTPTVFDSTINQSNGLLQLGVEKDEGTVALSSDGKWRLTGDFDIRLYLNWDSYYNEYRSITHTFLKVGFDSSNAARVSFTFDGFDSFQYSSEIAVNRNLTFFDWVDNGTPLILSNFSAATSTLFLKITRSSGVIKTFISTGEVDTQIGDDITDSVFSDDLFVELGVEAKEYNTYRSSFSKFLVLEGEATPNTQYFSNIRGTRQDFPDTVVMAIDDQSISIIDEKNSKLWMRLPIGSESPIPDSSSRLAACNGVIYITTNNGLLAFDFPKDRIYRYINNEIQISDEPLALRASEITFRTSIENIGTLDSNSFNQVACRSLAGSDFIAASTDEGVSVFRALSSGVANTTDGVLAGEVKISEKGALYWAGYDPTNNVGELSQFSNITALSNPGTNVFSRSIFYDIDSTLNIFGNNITTFDVRTVETVDLIGVGTTEGITFLSFSPGAPSTESFTYGVEAPAENPFKDPSFEDYLGLSWQPFVEGTFLERFRINANTDWVSDAGDQSIRLHLTDPLSGSFYEAGSTIGVYQMVDLTGVSTLYYDLRLERGVLTGFSWNFEVLVDGTVVRSIPDTDGPFTRLNDSADVRGFNGLRKLSFRIHLPSVASNTGDKAVSIDNIRTKIGDPRFRILPAGNASIQEVLLQYDTGGHKIYFSSQEGYGAVDLDSNTLDYFIPVQNFVPQAENISADFSRIQDEV